MIIKKIVVRSRFKKHLKEFADKTLVIDTGYLYQFIGEGSLMENMCYLYQ